MRKFVPVESALYPPQIPLTDIIPQVKKETSYLSAPMKSSHSYSAHGDNFPRPPNKTLRHTFPTTPNSERNDISLTSQRMFSIYPKRAKNLTLIGKSPIPTRNFKSSHSLTSDEFCWHDHSAFPKRVVNKTLINDNPLTNDPGYSLRQTSEWHTESEKFQNPQNVFRENLSRCVDSKKIECINKRDIPLGIKKNPKTKKILRLQNKTSSSLKKYTHQKLSNQSNRHQKLSNQSNSDKNARRFTQFRTNPSSVVQPQINRTPDTPPTDTISFFPWEDTKCKKHEYYKGLIAAGSDLRRRLPLHRLFSGRKAKSQLVIENFGGSGFAAST